MFNLETKEKTPLTQPKADTYVDKHTSYTIDIAKNRIEGVDKLNELINNMVLYVYGSVTKGFELGQIPRKNPYKHSYFRKGKVEGHPSLSFMVKLYTTHDKDVYTVEFICTYSLFRDEVLKICQKFTQEMVCAGIEMKKHTSGEVITKDTHVYKLSPELENFAVFQPLQTQALDSSVFDSALVRSRFETAYKLYQEPPERMPEEPAPWDWMSQFYNPPFE